MSYTLNLCVLVILLIAQESASQTCVLKPDPNGQKCTDDLNECPSNYRCVFIKKCHKEGSCFHVCAGFAGIPCPVGKTCCYDNNGVYKPEPPPNTADFQGICL